MHVSVYAFEHCALVQLLQGQCMRHLCSADMACTCVHKQVCINSIHSCSSISLMIRKVQHYLLFRLCCLLMFGCFALLDMLGLEALASIGIGEFSNDTDC